MAVETIEQLHEHLQAAIELEHSTIPVYLCAMYTIMPGTNQQAYDIIRSVVVEEMLHMTLAANVLNAVGGAPSINHPDFIPRYPTWLPDGETDFKVNLLKFSREAIDTFLKIELPTDPKKRLRAFVQQRHYNILAKGEHYETVGQFYTAIKDGLEKLTRRYGIAHIFCGDPARQIPSDLYYASGGGIVQVTDLETACAALEEIIEQGEGLHDSIYDDDPALGHPREIAHYFRFKEIREARYYQPGDTPQTGPRGAEFKVEWDKAFNMYPNPKTSDYPEGSELYQRSVEFNLSYSRMLNLMHDAFNGQPQLLIRAVQNMFDLKYKALELIKNPFPGKDGYHAGPTFEYIDLSKQAIINRLNGYFAAGNVDGIVSLLSDDLIWEIPGPTTIPYVGIFVGQAGFRDFWSRLNNMVMFEGGGSQQLIAQADQIVSLGWERGMIKATGKVYEYQWAQVYTINVDHKISRMYQYFNPLSVLSALTGDGS